jgi:hypothetical protein
MPENPAPRNLSRHACLDKSIFSGFSGKFA